MKKLSLFYSMFLLLVCCCTLAFGSRTALAEDIDEARDHDVSVWGNIVQNEPGRYTLYDNYTKFDGTVYEYNLDTFFTGSSTKFYTYTIVSGDKKDGSVVVEENILRIVPHNPIAGTIVIKAADRNGDSFDIEFALKYIDATAYITRKVLSMIVWVLLVLLILLAANVCVPFRGSVNVTGLTGGNSIALKKILGMAFIPRNFPVRGWVLGRNGRYVKFIPRGDVYIMDENHTRKIRAVRVDCGAEIKFFADEHRKDGIELYFYQKY